MDTALNKQIPSIFRQPPEDASSIFLWNPATQTTCYSNLDHIFIFTTVKTWSQELWNISDRSVDDSCWENWMTSTTLLSLPKRYLMLQCFAQLLCYSLFTSPHEKRKKWEVWKERKQRREKGEISYIDRFISRPKYTQCYNVIHSHTHTHTHTHSAICYNEQFLEIKSGCYNEHGRYNELGGILSADVVRACTWRVRL